MRFKEILQISEVNLFEAIDFDQEDYGNWQVKMSKKPVVMGQVTGPEAKYVALIQHRRKKDIKIFGTGSSQAAAREDGLTKAQATDRSDNVDKFKSFTGDLNVNFTKEYLEADTVPFYKFERNSEGIFLVQASKKYFKEFGREIEQLGFKKASGRLSRMGEMATQIYGFSISKNTIKEIGLVPNMRYALKYVNDDEDGNAMFLMVADSRAQGPQDKYRMNMPGITIAGTLTDDINEDLRKWFKDKWVRFGPDGKIRGDCARDSESEGKPKCLPQSKAQALGKKKRASAAAKKRREDPNAERRGAAKNVATKVREEQFDENCWKGYHKEGNKKMFGKTVPNCVKNEAMAEDFSNVVSTEDMIAYLRQHHDKNLHQDYLDYINTFSKFVLKNIPVNTIKTELSGLDREKVEQYKKMDFSKAPPIVMGDGYILDGYHRATVAKALGIPTIRVYVGVKGVAEGHKSCPKCGGLMLPETAITEKKDACYYKVKSRYKVWPSAYASGALVQCRKKGAANWGKKS